MLTIIKGQKVITWNYKRLIKNLGYVVAVVYFIAAFLICSYMDYLTLIHK